MSVLAIIVLAILVVLALLALVGGATASRRNAAGADQFAAALASVDRDLATAHAADRGWDKTTLELAARDALARQRPGVEPTAFELTQVLDRPGTDDDRAIFRAHTPAGPVRIVLGRRDGAWFDAAVEDER